MDADFKEIAKFQFESAQARLERVNTKLWLLCLLLIALLVASNAGWLYYIDNTDVEETTFVKQQIDNDNGDAFVFDGIHIGDKAE